MFNLKTLALGATLFRRRREIRRCGQPFGDVIFVKKNGARVRAPFFL
jgi:hypothetical protein